MPGSQWFRSEVDAGWAWVVAVASFALQFILIGSIQAFGIMYGSLMDEFKAGEAATAWVGALAYGLLFLLSPVTTAFCQHFGCRLVSCTGSLMCMTAMLVSSYVTSISTLYVTFGLLWGIGASLAFFPSMLTLRFFFDRKMSQANGVAMSGAGVGSLVINIVLRDINEQHGWRGCMRMLGGLSAGLFVCGCMFRPPPDDFCGASQWSEWSKSVGLLTKLRRIFDSRPWKVKGFAMWVLAHSTILFAYFTPYVYLIQFGKALGIPASDGAVLVGYLSVTATVGKLICGRLADLPRMRRLFLLAGASLALAASTMGLTAAENFDGMLTFVLIFGFFDGCFVVVAPQITQDVVGRPLTANALGAQYGLGALTMTLGPPVTGQIYKMSGSYNIAFFVGAALILVGVLLLYLVQRLRPDLTSSAPWPDSTEGQRHSANLAPGHSIESLISGLDTLSGMCIPSPSPTHRALGQMGMGDYQRFDHSSEPTTLQLGFQVSAAQVQRDAQGEGVDVRNVNLDHASSTTERDQSVSAAASSAHTIGQRSCSDLSRDSAVSEELVVLSSGASSAQCGSAVWHTGSASNTDLESASNQSGGYQVNGAVSRHASVAGIAVQIESGCGERQSVRPTGRVVSREDIILRISDSDAAVSRSTLSATTVDVQSLLSWENAATNEGSHTSFEVDIIKLPPPPPITKEDAQSSLLSLESMNEEAMKMNAENVEIFTSEEDQGSVLAAIHDTKTLDFDGADGSQEKNRPTGEPQVHPPPSSTGNELRTAGSTQEIAPTPGDVEEQSREEIELVRLPPPPQRPRTGTLVVVHDEPPLGPAPPEIGGSAHESSAGDGREFHLPTDLLNDCHSAVPVVQTAEVTSSNLLSGQAVALDRARTHRHSITQDHNAPGHHESNPAFLMPKIGTLMREKHEKNDQIHEVEDNERTQQDKPLLRSAASPQPSCAALSPDFLSTGERGGAVSSWRPTSHRSSINEPSQLSLLSQRLEAVAARQVAEELCASASADEAAPSMFSDQSVHSTPLLSANHSIPLTPMRAYSSYLTTPVATPAPSPFNFLFSPTDASSAQTPAEPSILHSPVDEMLAPENDLKYDSVPCRRGSFTSDWVHGQGANNESLGRMATWSGSAHGNGPGLESINLADTQESISNSLNFESRRCAESLDVGTVAKNRELDLGSQEKAQALQSTGEEATMSTNPFLAEATDDGRAIAQWMFASAHASTDDIRVPADGGRAVKPVRQEHEATSTMTGGGSGARNASSDVIGDAEENMEHLGGAVAPLCCTNPFISGSAEDPSTSSSTLDNAAIATDSTGRHQVQPDETLSETTGQPGKNDHEEQEQDANSTHSTATLCKNPFVHEFTEYRDSSFPRSIPEPNSQKATDAPVSTAERSEWPFGAAFLGDHKTDKATAVPGDMNDLFSSNPFPPPTTSDASPDRHILNEVDPWRAQSAATKPDDIFIRLQPTPPLLQQERNLAFLSARPVGTDEGHVSDQQSLQTEESSTDANLSESLDGGGGKEVASTMKCGDQDGKHEAVTLPSAQSSEPPALESEQVSEVKIPFGTTREIYDSKTKLDIKSPHLDTFEGSGGGDMSPGQQSENGGEDAAISPREYAVRLPDDQTPLLPTEGAGRGRVPTRDVELGRTSSNSSVATDDSSATDTSISENEMPAYHKLQGKAAETDQ